MDRTTAVCLPIYKTLNLSIIAHIRALNAAKKELEDLIEYRDSTGCVKLHHGVPATSGISSFFYHLGQLKRKKTKLLPPAPLARKR